MTKTTYDAIANRFRALWGKEAGWAHSVLFTADLKTFSERLVAKAEDTVTFATVKNEGDAVTEVDSVVETKVTAKRIKREAESEHQVLEVHEETVRKTKRRRKA